MSKEFVDNEIDEAHHLIKQGAYEQAVNNLKDLKMRIHEQTVLDEIKTFEEEHDTKLQQRLKNIEGNNEDPLRKQNDGAEQVSKYARAYLSFYDKLRKEHEIY